MKTKFALCLGTLVCLISSPLHSALTDTTWQGAAAANWNLASNWSGGLPDTNTERAVINGGGSPVILNTSPSIGGLSIASGFTLTRLGTDSTARTITLSAATAADTYFNNAGTISSGGSSGTLTLVIAQTAGTVINSGIMEATAGSELLIRSSATTALGLTNTNGTLRTVGSGVLSLGTSGNGSIAITGGYLQNASGTINQTRAATFMDVGVTNGGTFSINSLASISTGWGVTLSGTTSFTNTGTLNIIRNVDTGTVNGQSVAFTIGSTSASLSNSSTGIINITTSGTPGSGGSGATASLAISSTSEVTNNGAINLESKSTTNSTRLTVGADATATFSGTGEIVMKVGAGGSASQVIVAGAATSTLVNGTTHTIRGAGQLGNNSFGTITNAGMINADNADNALTINLTGTGTTGIFTNTGTLRASGTGGMVVVDGAYANSGTVRVDSGSSLAIQGGSFTSSGTLLVDGVTTSTPTVSLTGGFFQGSGQVTGNVEVGGAMQIAPGGTADNSLTVAGDLTFSTSGTLREIAMEFNNSEDVLAVTGTLSLGANNAFVFNFQPTAGYQTDTTYTLITGTNDINLSALSLSAASISNGFTLNNSFGTNGWNVTGSGVEVQFSAVPEPSTWALLAFSLTTVVFLRRRRRA